MLSAVEFNNELRGAAIEVQDVAIERDLAAEFRAMKSRAAQVLPQDLFRGRRIFAQSASELPSILNHDRMIPSPLPLSLRERGFYTLSGIST